MEQLDHIRGTSKRSSVEISEFSVCVNTEMYGIISCIVHTWILNEIISKEYKKVFLCYIELSIKLVADSIT